jgi:hypothetical protein
LAQPAVGTWNCDNPAWWVVTPGLAGVALGSAAFVTLTGHGDGGRGSFWLTLLGSTLGAAGGLIPSPLLSLFTSPLIGTLFYQFAWGDTSAPSVQLGPTQNGAAILLEVQF